MPPFERRFPHLVIRGAFDRGRYRRPRQAVPQPEFPAHVPREHAAFLRRRLEEARTASGISEPPTAAAVPGRAGVYLEFESEPGFDQFLERLDRKWVRLLNARRTAHGVTSALVYIETGKLHVFEQMLEQYGQELTDSGAPRHRTIFDTVRDIRGAALRSFWTDSASRFPTGTQAIWWEVWLRAEVTDVLSQFQEAVRSLGMDVSEEVLYFPDRVVTAAFGRAEQLSASLQVLDSLAELRRLDESPTFFVSTRPPGVQEWLRELLSRSARPDDGVAICLLDTGVNHGHPLIEPMVDSGDFQAARDEWGSADLRDHGTQMAGLALYGDLAAALASREPVAIPAALESVKILPNVGENEARLYGAITADAVHKAEIQAPERNRVLSMAVTADHDLREGRPSSWSAAVDQLSCGLRDDPARLFIVSAGNMRDRDAWLSHPSHLTTKSVEDPGQAWNALTVGATTNRWTIDDPTFEGWTPLAEPGDLAPSSSTSAAWGRQWPLKPDFVVEGGNAALSPDRSTVDTPDSLRLLTTHYQPVDRIFTTTADTSAACTLASRMAAQISRAYPELWPETVRGLLVHSSEWTNAMRRNYGPPDRSRTTTENLLRHCGYGVPSLDAALHNARNELTLIAQETVQPFLREDNRIKTNEIHVYSLPWPKEQLRELGEEDVELRVTLSYFVEPHPGERGWKYRHRYQSHGLRFEVRTPLEDLDQFRARVNDLSRDGDIDIIRGDSQRWTLGPDLRLKGSVHSDRWTGSAAELAERENIAVFPVTGWWKEYAGLKRWNCAARYSLIVSIRVPKVDIDIYTTVASRVGVPVEIET